MAAREERYTPDEKLLDVFVKVSEALEVYCEWEHEWICHEGLDKGSIMAIEEDLGCTKRNIADLMADKLVLLS